MNQQHTCVCMCFIYIMYICTCWQHMLSMLCVERWIHVEHIYYEFCDCIHTYIWATLTIRPNGNWTSKVTVGALTAKTGSHTGSYLGLYIPDSIWHIQWVDEWRFWWRRRHACASFAWRCWSSLPLSSPSTAASKASCICICSTQARDWHIANALGKAYRHRAHDVKLPKREPQVHNCWTSWLFFVLKIRCQQAGRHKQDLHCVAGANLLSTGPNSKRS